MGKKKTQNPKPQQQQQQQQQQKQEDLLSTLGDFTSKENWDKFFTLRGSADSFEWYAEWTQLKPPLLSLLSSSSSPSSSSSTTTSNSNAAGVKEDKLQILVPGCGNSRLSEHLYDAGFPGITNIDFSKVVISDMLRRNVRDRPDMRWRVMDMTKMQGGVLPTSTPNPNSEERDRSKMVDQKPKRVPDWLNSSLWFAPSPPPPTPHFSIPPLSEDADSTTTRPPLPH